MSRPRRGIGTIPVYGDIKLTPDELQTWEALFEHRGDVLATARALDLAPKTVKNRMSALRYGLHIEQRWRGAEKLDMCLLALQYLYPTMRWAEEHGIEWRRARRPWGAKRRGDTRPLSDILATDQ